MSAHTHSHVEPPLDLSRWRQVPNILIGVGAVLAIAGWVTDARQFGYSWLFAYMFFLSFCMGAMFLVLAHHLFDASWSVPIRRFVERMTCLGPVMSVLFIPVAVLAPRIYEWMHRIQVGEIDHSIHAKQPLFTIPAFYIVAVCCFAIWTLLGNRLRYWSLRQDQPGAAECTYRMRFHSFWGIWAFALTITLAAIMWMKSLQHEWFSTMYGVWYFAASVWVTLPTVYLVAIVLQRQGPLREVVQEKQIYFIGSLMLAFTVFWAYISFAQYFIIWNANMPEETFWYRSEERRVG